MNRNLGDNMKKYKEDIVKRGSIQWAERKVRGAISHKQL